MSWLLDRKLALVGGGILVAGLLFWGFARHSGSDSTFRTVEVERGDVEAVVSSTGALQATKTVDVGTQVSGQIAEIYADFNDHVREGQLIARIDPTLLRQDVASATAGVARARADYDAARREFDRAQQLFQRQVITQAEFDQAQTDLHVSQAALQSAQVSLERARRNLTYTEIRSPIDGVVVARNVDVGQTVAASLSAPTLFQIAQDLSEMEILVSVDESDIGKVHDGQPARFTVQAYPDTTFQGTVRQVRLQSTTQENVVNYTVVVQVDNPGGKLLPAMTATVEFITGEARDVLLVPNAALRFRPTEEMLAALRAEPKGAGRDSLSGGARRGSRGPRGGAGSDSFGRLWVLEGGKPHPVPVRTGLSDGQVTQIEGRGVKAGMQAVAAIVEGEDQAGSNPFQGQRDTRPGPPRPPGS